MNRTTAIKSFKSSLQSGETASGAHWTVRQELDDLLAELSENGLPTAEIMAIMEWWDCDVDPASLARSA